MIALWLTILAGVALSELWLLAKRREPVELPNARPVPLPIRVRKLR